MHVELLVLGLALIVCGVSALIAVLDTTRTLDADTHAQHD